MKGYIDNLERLGHPVTLGLGVSLILIDIRKEYDGFVQNYNMHNMGKTVNKLHAMLKLHEQTLPKSNAPALNAIRVGKVQKGNKHKKSHSQTAAKGQNHGKGKNKQAYAPKPKIPPPPKRENPAKDSKKNTASGAGGSGSKEIDGLMLMTMEPEIQQNLENLHAHEMLLELKTLFAQQAAQELLQTTRNFHSCKQEEGQSVSSYVLKIKGYIDNLERLRHPVTLGLGKRNCPQYLFELLKKKKLSQGASNSAVEAIGAFYLCLPSGLEIVLNNCHYAPSITRGVIFVFRLYEDGFINRFVNNTIQVSRINMVYFSVIPRDGIFEVDLSNSYANDSSMYAISNKRAKLDLDSTLLWHCHLRHISKKRIEKLQHDGLLNSTDLRTFEKCISCMSGKMARKPYTHQVERVKELLGLIHTDVCGPFKIMSRQGANYLVTFTDDFSRYGYVYLLKHKHEVFETFKVFQKEVENQLGKTIKLLRSDRGGEYTSQEFLDHLKDHGIIAHRTPPYTPNTMECRRGEIEPY
nr:hypothetical protein [Tanacetum cinerariifolium]